MKQGIDFSFKPGKNKGVAYTVMGNRCEEHWGHNAGNCT